MTPPETPRERRVGNGEANLLRRIAESAAKGNFGKSGLVVGMGDDAAVWRTSPGHDGILSCDWFLEGTHFLRDRHPADSIGWKCLARALSDVAAMGGVPRCFLLSLALPSSHTGRWLNEFLHGLRRASYKFKCVLAGGDTSRNRQILISVTVVGEARKSRAFLRSGARPGHALFTSGRLGEAEMGLRLLQKLRGRINSSDPPLHKHLYPEPRLDLGQWLAEKRLVSAMMDLSDGLSTDLPRLCAASGVGAHIYLEKLPAVQFPRWKRVTDEQILELALRGGDDYELLFAVPRQKVRRVPRSFQGIPLTLIGEITEARKCVLVDRHGTERALPNRGWDPFRGAK
jgi:thiamine-monophosphate kinase